MLFLIYICKLILVAGQSPSYDHNLYYIKLDLSMIEDFPVPIQYYIYKYATITSCVIISLLCCCSTIKCCYKNNFLNLASISDGVVYFYSRGGATVNATPTDEELPRGLSCSQIKRINERNFNLSDFHDQNTCTICLVDFIEGDNIKLLPCQHIYHCNCIMEWLYKNSLCPLCKRSVINKKGHIMQDVEWEDV